MVIVLLMLNFYSAQAESMHDNHLFDAEVQTYLSLFDEFKVRYHRFYKTEDDEHRRLVIFADNMKRAAVLAAANPLASFGVTKFADLSEGEFAERMTGVKHSERTQVEKALSIHDDRGEAADYHDGPKDDPLYVDWRTVGAVTSVKDQSNCSSSWAFAAVGIVESQWFLAGHPSVNLSAGELVSCDTNDSGCTGGYIDEALSWLIDNVSGKLLSEQQFPYFVNGSLPMNCSLLPTAAATAIVLNYSYFKGNETALPGLLTTSGPIATYVDPTSWQMYTGGIMTSCVTENPSHAVVIVGFDERGITPFWIVKNSWGTNWGEEGYIRIEMDLNLCGITSQPISAVVAGTRPPSTPFPPSPPTPAPPPPQSYFIQAVCSVDDCSEYCACQTFPVGECVAYGSVDQFAEFDCVSNETASMRLYHSSCGGTLVSQKNFTLGECSTSQTMNYCGPNISWCADD